VNISEWRVVRRALSMRRSHCSRAELGFKRWGRIKRVMLVLPENTRKAGCHGSSRHGRVDGVVEEHDAAV
jgi:hypothetical protein